MQHDDQEDSGPQHESRYRPAISLSEDVIIVVDSDGNILIWNEMAQRLFGYRQNEAVGRGLTDLIIPERYGAAQAAATANFSDPGDGPAIGFTFEQVAAKKDGTEFPIELTLSRIKLAGKWNSVAILRDITRRKTAEREMQKVNETMRMAGVCADIVLHAKDETQFASDVCKDIVSVGGYPMAWIGIADGEGPGTLCPIAQEGGGEGYLAAQLTWTDAEHGNTPAGSAIRSREPFIVRDVSAHPAGDPWHEEAIRRRYGSCIALPLRIEERLISNGAEGILGVMCIYAEENTAMFPAEVKELLKFANDIAYGFKMIRANKRRWRAENALRTTLTETIGAAASAIGKRDLYSASHQQEVAELSRAIGTEMGMDDEQCEGLYLGSTIYDIGNISIPSEILNRPGALTNAEFAIIKNHPQAGYEIMSRVGFPWPINEMILQHHERLDGSGYPHGLKEGEIIPEARVVALADVVAAMTSHRPYRPSLDVDETLDEISKQRGRLFDPDVVDACINLFRHKGFKFGA